MWFVVVLCVTEIGKTYACPRTAGSVGGCSVCITGHRPDATGACARCPDHSAMRSEGASSFALVCGAVLVLGALATATVAAVRWLAGAARFQRLWLNTVRRSHTLPSVLPGLARKCYILVERAYALRLSACGCIAKACLLEDTPYACFDVRLRCHRCPTP